MDGDGYDDLVPSPRGGDASRSSVTVVYGSEAGPGERTTTVDRDTPGVPGEEPQDEDAVFSTLDTGDVNGDGYADVVAGAPRWDIYEGAGSGAGAVPGGWAGRSSVVRGPGCSTGTTSAPSRAGTPTSALVGLTDLDGDGRADLVVTAPGSDTVDGVAWLLPGTAGGPPPRASPGCPGTPSTTPRGWAC
ncbi:VCBS repeat-containing protein [Streptomyces thinghirensis]|nr:VCBS repeat-containing protein [Streptomyces thinghirensis]